jgi:hypothetical protein
MLKQTRKRLGFISPYYVRTMEQASYWVAKPKGVMNVKTGSAS